jgi:outer membrane receptor for ferrienterochelin and colicin
MNSFWKFGALTIMLSLIVVSLNAQNGKISGKVTDAKSGETLIGVAVYLEGTTVGASTDLDGKYLLSNLKPGSYSVVARYVSYKTKTVGGVEVKAGEVATVNFSLEENTNDLKEFEVQASYNRENANVQLLEQKNAAVVSDGISADIIRKTPDNAASDVMKRISGASIQDNKFAVIRGLNDRYNLAYINGAPLPSTESDRRAFSFDLFPSNMLDNLVIYKTASPDLPAEFAGGVIQINTKEIPDEGFVSISTSAGYNSITTFKDRLDYDGSKTDWLGYDNGERGIPSEFPEQEVFKPLLTSDSMKIVYGSMFKNNWKVNRVNTPINTNGQLSAGFPFKIFKAQAGVLASISRSESFRYSSVERNFYDVQDNNTLLYNYNDSLFKQEVLTGAMFNFSVKPGPKSKIFFKNTLTLSGEDQTVRRRGLTSMNLVGSEIQVQNTALWYTENRLITSQLGGEHVFSAWNIKLKWNGGLSNIQREIPDFRRVSYSRLLADSTGPYRVQMGNQAQLEQAGRFFSNLNEDIRSAGIDLAVPLEFINGKKLNSTFKTGYYFQERVRQFDARQFGYIFRPGPGVPQSIRQLGLDSVFDPANFIFKNGRYFLLEEATNPNDSYSADSRLNAAYFMLDQKFFNKLRLVYGVRYEEFLQRLYSLDSNGDSINVRTLKPDFLPSINATYELTSKSNLRFSASRTLSRPEFREIAPFAFFDFNIDYVIAGNPNLERASIENLDLRWEYFPGGGEIISASVFSKRFTNAIEFINDIDVGAGSRRFGFANVPEASNYGVELELRKNFAFLDSSFKTKFFGNLIFIGNFSYIVSEIDLTQFGLASTGVRPLQGQSPYLINTGLQYNDIDKGFGMSFMVNRVGRRIAFVGNAAVPDIYENPRTIMDFQVSKKLFKKLDVKITLGDLLAQDQAFYMDLNDNKKYDIDSDNTVFNYTFGRNISLGLSLKF